jgi:tetratricopeptide (TPR) repeat protein
VNEDDEIKASLESVVLFKLDAEKGEGVDLAKEYNVKGYPTFVMLNQEGQTADRWIGYAKDYFLTTMDGAVKDMTPITEKLSRFESAPKMADALALARYNGSLNEYAEAVRYFTEAQKMKKDQNADYTFEIFDNTAYGARKDIFTFEDAMKSADAVLTSDNSTPDDIYSVARTMTSLAVKKDRPDDAAPYLDAGIKALKGSDDPGDVKNHSRLMADYSLYVTKDKEKAVTYKKQTMPEGWLESPGDLNSFAWWCFENKVDLEEAEQLSRKSVKLADSGKQKAQCLDTLAEICNELGDCRQAVELTKMAIKEAPEDEYFAEQLERFEKILASKN